MEALDRYLKISATRHSHLCPRQILGARVALAGLACLEIRLPLEGKPLLVITETDGCFVDGIEAVTGASVGHRTLRVEDYGKLAATFVDVKTEKAFRLSLQADIREKSALHAPEAEGRYALMLQGYQLIPDRDLLHIAAVSLMQPLADIISEPGARVTCSRCGEEIINRRELYDQNEPVCKSCAGMGYYREGGNTRPDQLPVYLQKRASNPAEMKHDR